MAALQIHTILDKLDELRTLFVLGQRAVPLLEEMFSFLQDVSSLLDDINASIRESTVRMMPHATSRLESVTQATEMATTEILDFIDDALGSVRTLKRRVEESAEGVDAMARADARLIRLLRAALRGRDADLLERVEAIHHEKKALRKRLGGQIHADVEALDTVNETLNHIMIALQVQDITAQQLAAVNHLIASIRDRMDALMVRMGAPGGRQGKQGALHRAAAFDPNAEYDRSGEKQRAADALIAALDDTDVTPASQEVVDPLFRAGEDRAPRAASSPASQEAIDRLFRTQHSGFASQDDIDKLFGAQGCDPTT